ncbi:MAG: pyridoxal phosphate-dependent aminotransferase [Candidatus Paceibacterota bacterium]
MYNYSDKERIKKDKTLPDSIRYIARMYPDNQVNRQSYGGLPHLGNALWGSWSLQKIQKAYESYDNYSLSKNLLIDGFKHPKKDKVRLGTGSPARFNPFNQCIDAIKNTLSNRILSDYPLAAGDDDHKECVVKYFNNNYPNKINKENIIFTHSSTQGFKLIMESILDYGDIVIMTEPTYGLFSFIPERTGGRVRFLKLTSKDNWKINPKELEGLILSINKELKEDYDKNRGKYIFRRSDTSPKVSAFVHINPHNPTGIVYGRKNKSLLKKISNICKNSGVFLIDDLAYSGLEYDRNETALPIYSIKGHFDNTITLHTLSKSYGLSGLRSGIIICNEVVSSLIRDKIFQTSDSLSILQSSAMSTIFSLKENIQKEKEKYLSYVTNQYYERFIFVKSIIDGSNTLKNSEKKIFNKILKKTNLNISSNKIFKGIHNVEIIIKPESGFFVLLDLSNILGKSYKGFNIIDDKTLLQFLYTSGNIKVLTGNAFYWGDDNQLVARVTIALEYSDLLDSFQRLKSSIESLI